MTEHESVKLDIRRAARLPYRQSPGVADAGHLGVAARRATAETARVPVPPLRRDFRRRLRESDPDLFEGREN